MHIPPRPVRRVYIPKANGKLRPLGIPTIENRLVQEVVRTILEAIYESVFLEQSHGFRPGKSCHTALEAIRNTWTGCKWLIEVDVRAYFDTIDHGILLKQERAMRSVALSRKNALFAGPDEGGERWAAIASLVETCKLNGINPQTYFTDLLTRLVNGWPQARIDELMPWNRPPTAT